MNSKKLLSVIVSVVLLLGPCAFAVASVVTGAGEIPPGPSTSLPDYAGAPAKAHPTVN